MDRRIVSVADDAITLQAAEWLLELQRRDVEVERILAWQAWMAADARHKDAFDRLQEIQECVGRIESLPWPTDREVAEDRESDLALANPLSDRIGDSYHLAISTAARSSTEDRVRPRRRRAWIAGLAASLLTVAVALSIVAPRVGFDLPAVAGFNDSVIQTDIGELRRVQLADGSTMTLGGFTRVSVDMSEHARRIILARGEAFFEVAKDPNRPFVVEVDDTAIRAVGTAFDVRRAGSQVSVSVAEGIVEVLDTRNQSGSNTPDTLHQAVTRLSAGQSIQFEPKSVQPPPPVVVDADTVAAWRNGQRQYLAEPLANVIADLNRYSTRQITIEDPTLSEMAITGSIFERDIERWVKSLEVALPVEVEEHGERIRIRRREDGQRAISAQP